MADIKEPNSANASNRNPVKAGKSCEYMTYSAREAYKRLRTNVMISLGEKSEMDRYVIGVTSAQPSEGKSTISVNLAYSLAELGNSVVLLDCDLRRPTIHTKLGFQQIPGLTELLAGKENLSDAVSCYRNTTGDNSFDVIAAGSISERPSEILSSKNFIQLLNGLKTVYDIVILDLPPVNAVIDATVVSKLTDGLVLVIRENHCPRFVLQDCIEQLQYAKANILGFVMNGSVNGAGKRYQYGKAYRYGNDYRYSSYYGK